MPEFSALPKHEAQENDGFAATNFARLEEGLAAGNSDRRAGYIAR